MAYDAQERHRRSMRLRDYDYAQAGAYYVTICAQNRECLFGDVVDGEMRLNALGEIVQRCWNDLSHYAHVELDEFLVMPNHVHGIIVLTDVRGRGEAFARAGGEYQASVHANASPLQMPHGTKPGSLSAITQNFKSVSTRRINQMNRNHGASIWQRAYYEHIVRNQPDLERIRQYITNNPGNWAKDEYNPKVRVQGPL